MRNWLLSCAILLAVTLALRLDLYLFGLNLALLLR